MNISFERMGVIKKGDIRLNDLTLLCGPNNTGKTYAMYSLYGLLDKDFEVHFDFVQDIVDKLLQKNIDKLDLNNIMAPLYFDGMIQHIEKRFHKRLPSLFSVEESEFANTKIKLTFDREALLKRAIKNEWKIKLSFNKDTNWFLFIEKAANQTRLNLTLQQTDIPRNFLITVISSHIVKLIFSNISHRCFLLPAERTGMNLFFKELSSVRNQLLHHAQKDNINPMEVLHDIMKSRYAEPISDYIEFLNNLHVIKKSKGNFSAIAQDIQKKILKGKYEVDRHDDIYFLPYRSGNKKMQLHFTSSTVNSLFGLVFYLKHVAQKGYCLMIDEPELNLHPDNQRIVARIFVQLVNAGLKVIVSTHSAHFVRELNNLIMLNQSFSQKVDILEKYDYLKTDRLDSNRISAYLFDKQKIMPMELEPNEGIIAETFDQTISNLNQSSNDIYYAIQEGLEESDG